MKSIYNLYEASILDIDGTLDYGDIDVANKMANKSDSKMREVLMHGLRSEPTPFMFSKEGGKYQLYIFNPRLSTTIDDKSKDAIEDTLGDRAEKIVIEGIAHINTEKLEDITSSVTASTFTIRAKSIKNVEITASPTKASRMLPNINIKSEADSATVENCRFEIESTMNTQGFLYFNGDIPKFKNVKSDSIKKLGITNIEPIVIDGKKTDVDFWNNPLWNKIFEFGYKIENTTDGKTIPIKNMKSFRSLLTSRNFNFNNFSEFPYRFKTGSKLSDFIDISKFKNLQAITINDNKMGVLFFRPEKFTNGQILHFHDYMLKRSWEDTIVNTDKMIPETADGWKVIIYKA